MNCIERWKTWRDGTYEVSTLGNIRRAKPGISTFVGRPVCPTEGATGYLQVQLKSDGKSVRAYVHHVVMEAFVGPRPNGHFVNHKDFNKHNNALTNLEYITQRENCRHAIGAGRRTRGPSMPPRPKKGKPTGDRHWTHRTPDRIARGARMPHSKLTAEIVRDARRRALEGETQSSLAHEYGISVAQMSRVIRGTRWTYV